jgi:hypothetical protein
MSVRFTKERYSTIETIKILLNHSPIMEKAISRMDKAGERFISEVDLGVIVLDYKEKVGPTERIRLEVAFSLKNLLETHVLADKDTIDGVTRYIFQESVLGLFRLCNASLFQELTDSKLKSLLASLWRLENVLSDRTRTPYGSFDFKESVDELFSQLATLQDSLQRNVERMRSVGSELESMTTQASKGAVAFASSRGEYLSKITHLFERHIQPTQTFLNPKTRIEEGPNLFELLVIFRDIFDSLGMSSEAVLISRSYLSFSNIFKPIDRVAEDVGKFIYKTRKSIAEFNALESAYQCLVHSYQKTLSADLRRSKIGGEFVDLQFAHGLKRHSRPIPHGVGDSPAYVRAVINEIDTMANDALCVDKYKDVIDGVDWCSTETVERVKRIEVIKDLLVGLRIRDTEDLAKDLHNRIHSLLPLYSLVDLFAAIRIFESEFLPRIAHSVKLNFFAVIEFNDYRYSYRITRVSALSGIDL